MQQVICDVCNTVIKGKDYKETRLDVPNLPSVVITIEPVEDICEHCARKLAELALKEWADEIRTRLLANEIKE